MTAPLTLADLISGSIPLGIHCHPCGRFVSMDARAVTMDDNMDGKLPPDTPLPIKGRFTCARCKEAGRDGRDTEARPDFSAATKGRFGYGGG